MIDRYQRDTMKNIFSLENRYSKFLLVEKEVVSYLYSIKTINDSDYEKIMKNAKFDLKGIQELEKETKHDVIAFTRNVSSYLGDERKWIHYGLTSTDVVDTASALIHKDANDVIFADLLSLKSTIKNMALKYRDTPCIGRTHGIHAEVTSFGLKWAEYYDELERDIERFNIGRSNIEVGMISGAVGTYLTLSPDCQDYVCSSLKINSSKSSTQVLSRDLHACYASSLVLISGLIEKISTEIRNLERTEIREVEEGFSINQKGSSAMPHKHNPISSENLCGCARLMRGYITPIYEDMALWHERDISHSSVERVALADMITLLDYMLDRENKVIKELNVYPERMIKNIHLTNNVIFSERVLTSLIDKGYTREKAYDLIQPIANKAYNEDKDFLSLLEDDKILSKSELDSFKDLSFYLRNIDIIYKRIGIID